MTAINGEISESSQRRKKGGEEKNNVKKIRDITERNGPFFRNQNIYVISSYFNIYILYKRLLNAYVSEYCKIL